MELFPAFVFLALTVLGMLLFFLISKLLGPKNHKICCHNFESGMVSSKLQIIRHNVIFLPAIIIFLCFLVAIALILPWILNNSSTVNRTATLFKFIFLLSVVIAGHLFVVLSAFFNWKKM